MMHPLDSAPSILLLGGEQTERLVTAALDELHVRIDRLEDATAFGRSKRSADLILLESARLDGPDTVAAWFDADLLDPSSPLLLTAPSPVDRADYRAWLEAGIWEVVRLPVDPALLSLRLRNLLGGRQVARGTGPSITPAGPYPWPSLVRATEETLALGRRYGRPVSCVALAVDQQGVPAPAPESARLMYRMGVAAQEWVRGSDLVGLSEHDVLLAVLPDTTGYYADILGPRLVAVLERSLRRAGIVAGLRSTTREASPEPTQSATEFLLGAVRQVT